MNSRPTYRYTDSEASHTHAYLWPTVLQEIHSRNVSRLFELGCGNGAFAARLLEDGCDVRGVDPSEDGIQIARNRSVRDAEVRFKVGSAYDELSAVYGTFPCVISLEVVEHVYFPRIYAKCIAELLEPNGIAIVSTPYHSYWKNVALALSGKLDQHFTALWDHGHIKFWSVRTLTTLFEEQGMLCESVRRVGRVPTFAKSMILVFRKPG